MNKRNAPASGNTSGPWLPVLAAGALVLSGCGSGGGEAAADPAPAGQDCNPALEFCAAVPLSANACADGHFWPLSRPSASTPLTVHYSRVAQERKAGEILENLEHAWAVQTDVLGFSAPLDDAGACGADGNFDVFIWPGIDGAFVTAIGDNPQTAHDDYSTYMAIDPTGTTGGAFLATTLSHELNHAAQASDDWWESAVFFEMSATFVEALVYPERDDYYFTLHDFQSNPEWSLFYDDDYSSWYMYGAAMYLHFLQQRYFPDDPRFIARIWQNARSESAGNEPDFIDAMRNLLLADRGIALDDAVTEFMQWRWFVAEFDDGAHFSQGGEWPSTVSSTDVDAMEAAILVDLSVMTYGASYLRLVNDSEEDRRYAITLQSNDPDTLWQVATTDDIGVSSLSVPPRSSRVVIVTALPAAPVSSATLTYELRTASVMFAAQ